MKYQQAKFTVGPNQHEDTKRFRENMDRIFGRRCLGCRKPLPEAQGELHCPNCGTTRESSD